MRVHRAMLALTLLCCASASILAQDKRAMTVNDLLELVRIGDVAMTPDGSRVFYSERHLDWETNKYEKKCARDEDHDAVRERARGELATVHPLLSAGQNRETLPPCQIRAHDAGEDDQRERRPRTEIDSRLDEKTELHGGDDDEQQKKLSHTAIIETFSGHHRKKELQMDNSLQSLRFDTGVRRQRCGWWNHDVGELPVPSINSSCMRLANCLQPRC